MEKKMFYYQREQTDTAKLQDELTGALIALARAVDGAEIISPRTSQVILKGLFTTITNVSFDNAAIEKMIREVRVEKERLVPDCSNNAAPDGIIFFQVFYPDQRLLLRVFFFHIYAHLHVSPSLASIHLTKCPSPICL